MQPTRFQYRCTKCGKVHSDLPDVGGDFPFIYSEIPPEERKRRVRLTSETCVIDETEYLIRAVIEIPIHDYAQQFGFGVWLSQERENFLQYVDRPDSEEIGPFFGWLCTRILYYEQETLALKACAHFLGRGLRPLVELEPTDHPLAVDQRNGIAIDKAWEIVHYYEDSARAVSAVSPKRRWWRLWR